MIDWSPTGPYWRSSSKAVARTMAGWAVLAASRANTAHYRIAQNRGMMGLVVKSIEFIINPLFHKGPIGGLRPLGPGQLRCRIARPNCPIGVWISRW